MDDNINNPLNNPFEKYADRYDSWYEKEGKILYENELKCLQALIENYQDRALDVGVGSGRFTILLKESWGIDLTFNPLLLAKKRGVFPVKGSAYQLPFKKEIFGCVLMIVTLCFLKDPLKAFYEIKRVLKIKGKLIVGAVFRDSLWGEFYENKKIEGHPFYRYAIFYSFQEFEEMILKVGFKVQRILGTLKDSKPEFPKCEEPQEILDKRELSKFGFLCVELIRN